MPQAKFRQQNICMEELTLGPGSPGSPFSPCECGVCDMEREWGDGQYMKGHRSAAYWRAWRRVHLSWREVILYILPARLQYGEGGREGGVVG